MSDGERRRGKPAEAKEKSYADGVRDDAWRRVAANGDGRIVLQHIVEAAGVMGDYSPSRFDSERLQQYALGMRAMGLWVLARLSEADASLTAVGQANGPRIEVPAEGVNVTSRADRDASAGS